MSALRAVPPQTMTDRIREWGFTPEPLKSVKYSNNVVVASTIGQLTLHPLVVEHIGTPDRVMVASANDRSVLAIYATTADEYGSRTMSKDSQDRFRMTLGKHFIDQERRRYRLDLSEPDVILLHRLDD